MPNKYIASAIALLFLGIAAPALAKDIVVQMKNQVGSDAMVFEPAFIKAMPGDVVHFMPTDPGHSAATIDGMVPAGVAAVAGGMSKEMDLKVTAPGIYGIECQPHFSMGMVALVQVGAGPSANLAAARAFTLPPLAKKRMAPLLAQAK
jgi:pseudoazurin